MPARRLPPHLQLIVDFHGCRTQKRYLQNPVALRRTLGQAIAQSGMEIVGHLTHQFAAQGRGVTAVFIVAESHVVVHTWPETGLVNLDIFFCNFTRNNKQKARRVLRRLAALCRPRRIVKQVIRHRL
jgi:S-adenosylmethionine decarboxylase proenzyme